MKGNSGFQIGTGITSILMIFVILCLTTFGILSYTSANADYSLTEKNADYVTDYCDAYSELSDELAVIDKAIYSVKVNSKESDAQYFDKILAKIEDTESSDVDVKCVKGQDSIEVTLSEAMNDSQMLIMVIKINGADEESRYNIMKNYVYSESGAYSEGETLPDMWGGE